MIYLFKLVGLFGNLQSYGVDRTSLIFAVNSTGRVNVTGLVGIIGNLIIKLGKVC